MIFSLTPYTPLLRRLRASLFGLIALLVIAASPAQAGVAIQQWQHSSGAQIWLAPAMGIPMVDVRIEFDAGSRREPASQTGLTDMVALMMDEGAKAWNNTAPKNAAELANAWADLGAQFSSSADQDSFGFNLRSLSESNVLQKAASLAAQQMAAPAFEDASLRREKERTIAALRDNLTQPDHLAQLALSKVIFGQHPYGREPSETSLQAMSAADLQNWYRQHIAACRACVIIVGAIQREQADDTVNTLLAGIRQPCSQSPALPAIEDAPRPRAGNEQNIPFNSAQAHVLMGQVAIKRSDPDFFPLFVGNYILGGGGFVSRLTEQVREKRGLSYSVYSYFAPGANTGPFTIGLQTRPDQAEQAKTVALQVLREFIAQGPTERELKAAKDFLIGGFALRIDSNRKILDNLANIARNQLPLDYLDTWQTKVARISKADIQAAFARTVNPDTLSIIVLGGSGK